MVAPGALSGNRLPEELGGDTALTIDAPNFNPNPNVTCIHAPALSWEAYSCSSTVTDHRTQTPTHNIDS